MCAIIVLCGSAAIWVPLVQVLGGAVVLISKRHVLAAFSRPCDGDRGSFVHVDRKIGGELF